MNDVTTTVQMIMWWCAFGYGVGVAKSERGLLMTKRVYRPESCCNHVIGRWAVEMGEGPVTI